MRAATRGSELARWQTTRVGELIADAGGPAVEPVIVSTAGDRRSDIPIHEMGGKGVFVSEVQAAVLDGRADIAVHSAKDLPAATPDGLVLVAVPERADQRDALVGSVLSELAPGAVVASGSVRRRAQLAWHRPDLTFAELRGNIATRLAKAARFDAVVMAAAAIDRLGVEVEHQRLDPWLLVPQVGQGALAVECRADDLSSVELLTTIDDPAARRAVDAERAFLAELGGDCDLPAGAHATIDAEDRVELTAVLASLDGRVVLRATRSEHDSADPGRAVARFLLDECGGADLMRDQR